MPTQRLKDLFERYYNGTASPSETEELKSLLASTGDHALLQLVDNAWKGLEEPDPKQSIRNSAGLKDIFDYESSSSTETEEQPKKPIPIYRKPWLRYAAILILAAGAAGYYYFSVPQAPSLRTVAAVPAAPVKNDVLPGGYKATLKLGDGSTVVLSPDHKGLITRQGGTNVFLNGSDLSYQTDTKTPGIVLNTMSTPRGGQYRLRLSDGTQVWLNAASSITYPIEFASGQRAVSVTGEVYFEVAKNAHAPFRIKVNPSTEIEVLGTAFNLQNYPDESSIRTTLVNGLVRVDTRGRQQLMRPGQQFQVYQDGESHLVDGADIQQVIAWKNGIFNFQRMKLEAVMRQLSRWYDVEIVYPDGVPDIEFGGKVQNSLNLQAMLEGLQAMDVHFKIDGKKVIVTQ